LARWLGEEGAEATAFTTGFRTLSSLAGEHGEDDPRFIAAG
jgi:hypothetical protein